MAALDVNSVRYCFENFMDLKDLIVEMNSYCTHIGLDIIAAVTKQIDEVELFVKKQFKMHLKPSSRCASHCIQHALASDDDKVAFKKCNHVHDLFCSDCDSVQILFANLAELIEIEIENRPLMYQQTAADVEMLEEFRERIKLHQTHLNFYLGHAVRSHHSAAVKVKIPAGLKEHQACVTADYKMKYLQSQYRESQQDWFAKAGMTWHGVWVSVLREKKFVSHFFHNVSDDKREDGFAIMSNIEQALKAMKHAFPELTEAYVMSDGAGAYSGAYLAINLAMMGDWTGIHVIAHFIGESGQGKSTLDAMFGVLTQALERTTRTGRQYDILKAADLRNALVAFGG